VIVTLAGLGIEDGAVYRPVALIVPLPEPDETLHVNVAVGALARNALNCAFPFTGTLAVPGKIVTGPELGGGGGGVVVVLVPPPHALKVSSAAAAITASERSSILFPVIMSVTPNSE
jgi:hypothetical protein